MKEYLEEKKINNQINYHNIECPFKPTLISNLENFNLTDKNFLDRVNKF